VYASFEQIKENSIVKRPLVYFPNSSPTSLVENAVAHIPSQCSMAWCARSVYIFSGRSSQGTADADCLTFTFATFATCAPTAAVHWTIIPGHYKGLRCPSPESLFSVVFSSLVSSLVSVSAPVPPSHWSHLNIPHNLYILFFSILILPCTFFLLCLLPGALN
jgi:hypothetical protein